MLWWRPLGGDRDQGGRDGWCWHCTGPASAHQPPSFSSLSGFWPAQHGTEPTKGVNKISRQSSKKSWSGILKPPMNILSICITQISFLIPGRDSVYMPISNSVLWDLWVQQQYLILVVVRCFQLSTTYCKNYRDISLAPRTPPAEHHTLRQLQICSVFVEADTWRVLVYFYTGNKHHEPWC